MDEALFPLEINGNRYPSTNENVDEEDDDDNRFIQNDIGVDLTQTK